MSYVPPPTLPDDPGPEPGHRRDLWLGIGVGVLACFGLPFLSLLVPDASRMFGLGLIAPLLVLLVGTVLVIPAGTRRWGTGLLMGFLISLVLGAGACVVLLASYNGA